MGWPGACRLEFGSSITYLVGYALLTREGEVPLVLAFLEPFWPRCGTLISVQRTHNATRCTECSVLPKESLCLWPRVVSKSHVSGLSGAGPSGAGPGSCTSAPDPNPHWLRMQWDSHENELFGNATVHNEGPLGWHLPSTARTKIMDPLNSRFAEYAGPADPKPPPATKVQPKGKRIHHPVSLAFLFLYSCPSSF